VWRRVVVRDFVEYVIQGRMFKLMVGNDQAFGLYLRVMETHESL
jgi:hypothetical protein